MPSKPLPRRDQVLATLASEARALHAREIASRLSVPEGQYLDFLSILRDLTFDGALRALPGQRYRSQRLGSDETVQGRLTVHPRGFGFVANPAVKQDLFIPPGAMAGGMHGDVVSAQIMARTSMGREGRIDRVLERANLRVPGVLRGKGRNQWLDPDDPRVRGPIVLAADGPAIGGPGDAAIALLTRFPVHADENPEGTLFAVLGSPGDPEVETRKVLIRAGISESFSPEAEKETAGLSDSIDPVHLDSREDLRAIPFITIDPEDARDHDDAIWVSEQDGGTVVWVAIADVDSYVRAGGALDAAARERSFSIYLPDRAVPMLPRKLASDLCSLVPDADRLCVALEMRISPTGRVKEVRFCEGVMRSRGKHTYTGVARAMKWTAEGKPDAVTEETRALLDRSDRLARLLRKRRLRRGALDFQIPEAQILLDPQTGHPIDVFRRGEDPGVRRAYRIVEELMILANETMASWLVSRGREAIFRVHPPPDEAKLDRLQALCEALELEFEREDAIDAKRLGGFLERIASHPLAEIVSMLALRSLKPAAYDTVNVGHFGLASDAYLHFTSPIRRYPDLIVHRAAKQVVREDDGGRTTEGDALHDVAMYCTQREREVVTVEREVADLYRALLMRDQIGETASGMVVDIHSGSMIVALDAPYVDVIVPFEWMGHEGGYEGTEDGLGVVGRGSGEKISLGDRVVVRIEEVHLGRKAVIARRISKKRTSEEKRTGLGKRGRRNRTERNHSKSMQKKRQKRR